MTSVQIALLIVAVIVLQAILWVRIIGWVKRKSARLLTSVRAELDAAAERVTRGPEAAPYRGGSGGRSKVKGNGVIVATESRVLFRKLLGRDIEVPFAELVGVKEDKWFLGAWTSGRPYMILELTGGDVVGFIVSDHAGWMAAMRERIGSAAFGASGPPPSHR